MEGLLPILVQAPLHQARTHCGRRPTSPMGAMHDDIAVLPPLCGKFGRLLELHRSWRNSVPTPHKQVGVVRRPLASLRELASQVDNARPRSAQLVTVAASEPPTWRDLVGHRDTYTPVPQPLHARVEPRWEVEAGEERVRPCRHLPGRRVLAQYGHPTLAPKQYSYDAVEYGGVHEHPQQARIEQSDGLKLLIRRLQTIQSRVT
mmetsp:Transcript_112367/g.324596  ORF Transcript_112367/g.324596 Transcript_112367/m.324596 type:complete len:204 (-) Transcript_112367:151-762(-)